MQKSALRGTFSISPLAERRWLLRVLAWGIASLLAAMIGPFTTYQSFDFSERFAYWGGLIGVAMVLAFTIRALVARAMALPEDNLRIDIVTSLVQAVVLGVLIWVFNYRVLGFEIGAPIWVLEHIGVVFVVCAGIVAIRAYLRQYSGRDPGMQAIVSRPPGRDAVFLRRLDTELGQDLLHVSANDHYLLVVTMLGETRVLMRFRDALDELSALPGYQIHRSHWVAAEAVLRVRQDGRRHVVELPGGKELPVSQAYLDALRDGGLLA